MQEEAAGVSGRRSALATATAPVPALARPRQGVPFLARVGHELRTPLNTVMTLTQLLLDGSTGALRPQQKKYVEVIQRNSETVLRLIGDFLDMSRLQAGQLQLAPVSFDIDDAISKAVADIRPDAEVKGLQLTRLPSPSGVLPPVFADPDRVGQVLANVIGNAIKFTDTGRVDVVTELDDRLVAVHITDTGIGIPATAQPGLFREFYQVDPGEGRRRGGSGLGLCISRGLVTAMGGNMWMSSTFGEGSRFSFTLPCDRRADAKRPTASG